MPDKEIYNGTEYNGNDDRENDRRHHQHRKLPDDIEYSQQDHNPD